VHNRASDARCVRQCVRDCHCIISRNIEPGPHAHARAAAAHHTAAQRGRAGAREVSLSVACCASSRMTCAQRASHEIQSPPSFPATAAHDRGSLLRAPALAGVLLCQQLCQHRRVHTRPALYVATPRRDLRMRANRRSCTGARPATSQPAAHISPKQSRAACMCCKRGRGMAGAPHRVPAMSAHCPGQIRSSSPTSSCSSV
jgi:hypothetical protein